MPKKKTPAKKRVVKKNTKSLTTQANNKSPWTQKQVSLITKTVAKGATMDELHLFLYTANKVKLDPLAKQIHFTKYRTKDGDQMAVITGIDGYRAIAERSGTYAGNDDPVYDGGKQYEPGKEPNQPSIATVTVYRIVAGQRVPFTSSARWKEYYPGEKKGFMWKKMPYLMLAKVAEALALRKAFPNDLSGLKTTDEMTKFEAPVDVIPENKITFESKNSKPTSDKAPLGGELLKKQKKAPESPEKKKTAKTTTKAPKDAISTARDEKNVYEGEIEEQYICYGCDIPISLSDKQLSEKLSQDGKPYCSECLKQYRK